MALAGADRVGAHPPGDGQQPGAQGRLAAKPGKGAQRPEVGFLNQVVDVGARPESATDAPNLTLGEPDDLGNRTVVTVDRRLGEEGQPLIEAPTIIGWFDRHHQFSMPRHRSDSAGWNSVSADDDCTKVDDDRCAVWQESLSARADGEPMAVSTDLLEAHVRRCWRCQSFAGSLPNDERVDDDLLSEDVPRPGFADAMARRVAADDRHSVWQVARWGLALVAAQIIAFAIPDLAGREPGESLHSARHLGAFTLAYGVALLVVVARPARARTVLPVAAMLSAALLITAVIDMVSGDIPFANELGHLPELASLALLWMVHRPYRRATSRRS